MNKKTTEKMAMSILASIGGKATLKKHGKKHFIKLGKLSGASRRKRSLLTKKK